MEPRRILVLVALLFGTAAAYVGGKFIVALWVTGGGIHNVLSMKYARGINHGPLTKGRITQRFLSDGVMETFLYHKILVASREG
jgi:hypothetical protein